jgi:hypothetical protein
MITVISRFKKDGKIMFRMAFNLNINIPEEYAAEMKEKFGISIEKRDFLGEACKKVVKTILLKTLKHMQEPSVEPRQMALLEDCVLGSLDSDIIDALIKDVEDSQASISM